MGDVVEAEETAGNLTSWRAGSEAATEDEEQVDGDKPLPAPLSSATICIKQPAT